MLLISSRPFVLTWLQYGDQELSSGGAQHYDWYHAVCVRDMSLDCVHSSGSPPSSLARTVLHASCFMLHASRFTLHDACFMSPMFHASCFMSPMFHASCFMLQTSSFMPQMLYVIVPSLDIFPLYTVMKLINSSAKGSNLTRLYYTIPYYTYDISRRLGLSHGLTSHTRHLRTWLEIRERTLFRIPRI